MLLVMLVSKALLLPVGLKGVVLLAVLLGGVVLLVLLAKQLGLRPLCLQRCPA